MKRIRFVINPISGTRAKESLVKQFDEIIDKSQFTWDVVYTERAGHAIELAAQAVADKIDIVGAVGGDGTMNEVGRSLIHSDTALAIIPFGSGNGLARHLGISMDPKKALGMMNNSVVESMDYGIINRIPFFCTCGMGFDAFISQKFAEAGKRGVLTYLEKTLQEFLIYKPETYELETEDRTIRYKAFLIACGNASQYGNNAYITPRATMNDGLLDVTILEPFTVLDVPSLAFQLFNKHIDKNSRIKTFQCRKLKIRRHKPGVVHIDGDPMIADEDLDIELFRGGLNVITPLEKKKISPNILQLASEYFKDIFSTQ